MKMLHPHCPRSPWELVCQRSRYWVLVRAGSELLNCHSKCLMTICWSRIENVRGVPNVETKVSRRSNFMTNDLPFPKLPCFKSIFRIVMDPWRTRSNGSLWRRVVRIKVALLTLTLLFLFILPWSVPWVPLGVSISLPSLSPLFAFSYISSDGKDWLSIYSFKLSWWTKSSSSSLSTSTVRHRKMFLIEFLIFCLDWSDSGWGSMEWFPRSPLQWFPGE